MDLFSVIDLFSLAQRCPISDHVTIPLNTIFLFLVNARYIDMEIL
jgi:hypothetical protein